MFKKQEEDREPRIKDFHLDPEQRKFIFAEEYLSGSEISIKEDARSQERLERKRKSRSKTPETPIQEGSSRNFLFDNKSQSTGLERLFVKFQVAWTILNRFHSNKIRLIAL